MDPQKKISHTNIIRIIPKAKKRNLTFLKYVVVEAEAKKASLIISTLKQELNEDDENAANRNSHFGFEKEKEKPFLKRVMKINQNLVSVIVCQDDDKRKEQIIEKLNNLNLIKEVTIKDLPKEAPLTKDQYEEWSKYWPINFIQQEISKEIAHSEMEKSLILNLMNVEEDYPEECYLFDSQTYEVLASVSGKCSKGSITHPIMKLLDSWSLSEKFQSNPNKYYYLTHLKMTLKVNICGMCAMALVHSRLKSLFLLNDPDETMDTIMGCPMLNHQIDLFKTI